MINPVQVSKIYQAHRKTLEQDTENHANANALSAELDEQAPRQRGQQREAKKHSRESFAAVLKRKLQSKH